MDEKKQINIDPSMLEIISKTRRKEPKAQKDKIPKLKLKIPTQNKNRVDQTFKSHALRFIRNKQQSMYDAQHTHEKRPTNLTKPLPSYQDEFKSDFDSSIDYLNTLNAQNASASAPKPNLIPKTGNHPTLRLKPKTPQIYNYAAPVNIPEIDETDIQIEAPKDIFDMHASPVVIPQKSGPKYGCLKNGTLPTYRTYNKTMRNTPNDTNKQWNVEPSFSEWMKRNSEQRKIQEHIKKQQLAEQNKNKTKEKQFNRKKLKKTIRRTYVVGRSSVQPKVSVLVSNRTIRRDIDIHCNKLKQSNLEDVKRDLIKKGFIKVGTTAPPDVLRKMYESINTLCGDVKNHNADNLVYNYFNDEGAGANAH